MQIAYRNFLLSVWVWVWGVDQALSTEHFNLSKGLKNHLMNKLAKIKQTNICLQWYELFTDIWGGGGS
jgi:hypothetical protein